MRDDKFTYYTNKKNGSIVKVLRGGSVANNGKPYESNNERCVKLNQ
jgi:hypothetical protein